jgi:hypothetical protein
MTSTTIRLLTGSVSVLALTTLSACGGGDDFATQSATAIRKAAIADMKTVDSLTLTGKLAQGASTVALDLSMNTDGDCTGNLALANGKADIISADGKSYLKGDAEFWAASAGGKDQASAIMSVLGDKWAVFPTDKSGFGEFCDLDNLLQGFEDDKSSGKATVGKVSKVDGKETVEVSSKQDGQTTVALVATGDKHYILKLSAKDGDSPGSFTFSDFNKKIDVTAPGADEILDLSQALG